MLMKIIQWPRQYRMKLNKIFFLLYMNVKIEFAMKHNNGKLSLLSFHVKIDFNFMHLKVADLSMFCIHESTGMSSCQVRVIL